MDDQASTTDDDIPLSPPSSRNIVRNGRFVDKGDRQMQERQQQLLDNIARAFAGVQLGDGVSLHETVVIDNYGSADERLAARSSDEKHDWHALIHDPELARICRTGPSGMCFFDAAGFRFHLPAFLSLAVDDRDDDDTRGMVESLLFRLTRIDEHDQERFAILNDAQRACVRDVLTYLRDTMSEEVEVGDPYFKMFSGQIQSINLAIKGYWGRSTER
jgi:hypothetical protein